MSSNATVQAGGYPQGGGYGGPPQGGGGFDPHGGAPGGGGGGFGPPPGGGGFPPGGGGGMTPGGGGEVNTTLPFILGAATFCGCGIFCVIPLFLAYQAHQAKQQGDMAGAQAKAKTATMVGGGMLGLGILVIIAYVVLGVVQSM